MTIPFDTAARPKPAPAPGGLRSAARLLRLVDDRVVIGLAWVVHALSQQVNAQGTLCYCPIKIVHSLGHGLLAIVVCYLLAPRFFAVGRYVAFGLTTLLAFAVYALSVELLFEPWIDPTWSGRAPASIQSVIFEASSAVSFMALAFVLKLAWDDHANRERLAELAREKSETELRFLRGQINPHVVFNCLNNIYAAVLEKSDRAPDMLVKLSGTLRYMLYESASDRVPLRRELDYLRDYVDLQRMALEGRGSVEFVHPEEPGDWTLAPGILVVFVENCFKHSLDTQEAGIAIRIAVALEGGALTFQAENTVGPAAPDAARLSEGTGGLGLANVRRRLQLLYPGCHDLLIAEAAGWFRVTLRLDLDRCP